MLTFSRYRQNSDSYMICIKPIHKIHSYTCKILKSDGDIKVQWLAPKSNDLVSCWTKKCNGHLKVWWYWKKGKQCLSCQTILTLRYLSRPSTVLINYIKSGNSNRFNPTFLFIERICSNWCMGVNKFCTVLLQVLLWPLDIINHPRSAIELWLVTPSIFGTDHWTLVWPSDLRVPSSFGILSDIFKLTITYILYCVTFCWQSNGNP